MTEQFKFPAYTGSCLNCFPPQPHPGGWLLVGIVVTTDNGRDVGQNTGNVAKKLPTSQCWFKELKEGTVIYVNYKCGYG